MRVIWKDSNAKAHNPLKYRGYIAEGYAGGWTINVPGDENIYRTHYAALNAIDMFLDGSNYKGSKKRLSYGVQIIEKKD